MLRPLLLCGLLLAPLLAGCLDDPGAIPPGDEGATNPTQRRTLPPPPPPLDEGNASAGNATEGPLEAQPSRFNGTEERPLLRVHTSSGCGGPCMPRIGFRHPPREALFVLFEDLRALVVEYNTDRGGRAFEVERNVSYDPVQLRNLLAEVPGANRSVWVVRTYTAAFPLPAHAWIPVALEATWLPPAVSYACADCTSTEYRYEPREGDERRAETWPTHNASDPFQRFADLVRRLEVATEARGEVHGPGEERPVRREQGPLPGCTSRQPAPRYQVIRDEAAFARAWREACAPLEDGAPPPRPKVDFQDSLVIAAFWGPRSSGGHTVEVRLAEQRYNPQENRYDATFVDVVRTRPGDGCAAAAVVTYPGAFHLQSRPGDLALEFRFEDRVRTCA